MSEYLALFDVHDKNRKWFEESYSALAKKYDGKFVAVYQEKVIGSDEDLDRLVKRIAKYPTERILIEYVSKEKIQLVL